MNTAEALGRARALIEEEDNWNKYDLARKQSGEKCVLLTYDKAAVNPDAHSFCAVGAMRAIVVPAQKPGLKEELRCELALYLALPGRFKRITMFNDHELTSHRDVLKLYDRAISLAEKEGI